MKKLLMTALTIVAMSAGVALAGENMDVAPDWNFATSGEVIETVSLRLGLNQDESGNLQIEQGTPCWPQVYSQVD